MLRFIHTTSRLWGTFDKSQLAKLRKKTGYTFSNCRKALEVSENDLEKAEKWLHEQAKALGWAKATKLEGRLTAQGLVGIAIDPNRCATIVEVNCETDFVARNKNFVSLVEQVTSSCLQYCGTLPESGGPITKALLSSEQLRSLPSMKDGSPLADLVALTVGTIGENMTLRRASCIRVTKPDILLSGYTHPAPEDNKPGSLMLGKFGAIVALTQGTSEEKETALLGRQLCQHIVGMCPERIGDMTEDEPIEDKDSEPCLVHQEFLVDTTYTVGQILEEGGTSVLDYTRFECGENLASPSDATI